MTGLLNFILTSLWHGLLLAVAVAIAALLGKAGGAPIAGLLQIHESIATAAIFFGALGLGGWLYNRFGPKSNPRPSCTRISGRKTVQLGNSLAPPLRQRWAARPPGRPIHSNGTADRVACCATSGMQDFRREIPFDIPVTFITMPTPHWPVSTYTTAPAAK